VARTGSTPWRCCMPVYPLAELASENIARDLSGAGTALSQKRTGERQQERAPHRGVGGKS
jgi:hypothetical protein